MNDPNCKGCGKTTSRWALTGQGLCLMCADMHISDLEARQRTAFEEGYRRGARLIARRERLLGDVPPDYADFIAAAATRAADEWLKKEVSE